MIELGLVVTILLPILAGLMVFAYKPMKRDKVRNWFVISTVVINALITLYLVVSDTVSVEWFQLTKEIPVVFTNDAVAKIYSSVIAVIWIACGLYAFEYMKHENAPHRYFCYFLITLGMLNGVSYSGNLLTLYMSFEFMSFASMPLVLHSLKKEAVSAGLKYIFYSVGGVSLALLAIGYFSQYTQADVFVAGGSLDLVKVAGHESMILWMTFLSIVGFGVKAGMFPLHGWLPTAHPVAPAPASALLSGVIVKAGIVAIVRVIFYVVGADTIRGTWVQTTWMILALVTVFMGSMLAYKEKILKKRLAYSTVSQVSYILVGLATLDTSGILGAFIHLISHALVKDIVFLCAGAIIYKTGKIYVRELRGVGKEMPITLWCFTFAAISLIGIPPTGGFLSKWLIAAGSLSTGMRVLSWLAPVILIISALLTAGYLLSIAINAFFPGDEFNYKQLKKKEPNYYMTVPLVSLTVLVYCIAMFPMPILNFVRTMVEQIL